MKYSFMISFLLCALLILCLVVNWLLKVNNQLLVRITKLEGRFLELETKYDQHKNSTELIAIQVVNHRVEFIEQAIGDVSRLNKTINTNLRLLTDKIDKVLKQE